MKSFVVRLFLPDEPEPVSVLRGLVEDVTSGRRAPFADGRQLLSFLAEAAPDTAKRPSERSST